jgi:hypothetical protein
LESLDQNKRYKLLKLQEIFESVKEDIEKIIKEKTSELGGFKGGYISSKDLEEMVKAIVEVLPVKIVKVE